LSRGLATEAARVVLVHAFDRLDLPRVLADVDEPNEASVRVLQRLGATELRRETHEGRPLLHFELNAAALAAVS
jgi:RimJ/RimL family protein N-acetyltransferase